MNKKERAEVVRLALKDAFAPRFAEIENELNEMLKRQIENEHPVFVRIIADPEIAPYLLTSTQVGFLCEFESDWGSCRMRVPNFDEFDREVTRTGSFRATVPVPATYSTIKVQAAEETNKKYKKAWEDYNEAKLTLLGAVDSYSSRGKFIKDFPNLAAYLPKLESKPKLPAIIPEQTTAKLSALGIPPQGEEK